MANYVLNGEGYEAVVYAIRAMSDYCVFPDSVADADVEGALRDVNRELSKHDDVSLALRDIFVELKRAEWLRNRLGQVVEESRSA